MPWRAGTKDAQPIDAYVGSKIRFRRNQLGISQMEMAERIGVTFQQVQKYEKGVNRIGASRLVQICDVLQVTPGWLFESAPGTKGKAPAREIDAAFTAFQRDHLAPRLVLAWRRLPTRIKRSIVAVMTAAAEGMPVRK